MVMPSTGPGPGSACCYHRWRSSLIHEQRDECPPGDHALSELVPAQNGPAAGSGSWQAEEAGEQPAAVVRIRLLGRFTVLRNSAEIPLRAFGGRLAQQLLR